MKHADMGLTPKTQKWGELFTPPRQFSEKYAIFDEN